MAEGLEAQPGDRQLAPTVASNGAGYLVAWQDVRNGIDRDLYATRLTTTGAVQDPTGLVLSTAMWSRARRRRRRTAPTTWWRGRTTATPRR